MSGLLALTYTRFYEENEEALHFHLSHWHENPPHTVHTVLE